MRRLNGILPADVRVRRVLEAPDGFDARFSALWRRYAYRIADTPSRSTRWRAATCWPGRGALDLDVMNAASALAGRTPRLRVFCKQREGATTIRTLLDLTWTPRRDGLLGRRVRADAFCHSMVRALVGCLMAVGEGRRPTAWAGEVLRAEAPDPAVTVMHAHGLTLEEVAYPADDELAARAERARAQARGRSTGR